MLSFNEQQRLSNLTLQMFLRATLIQYTGKILDVSFLNYNLLQFAYL
jgi:hypothetical protein